MIKRYLAPLVIRTPKQPHFIKIICLLAVIFGTQTVAVQLQITQDAHASSQQGAAVVPLPDPNLRSAIAEALGKSSNAPMTTEEMARLERLDARSRGIRDLTGLQFATNLDELSLNDNQISDLSPIAGLTGLRKLRLNNNPLADFSPLKGLKNLTHLWFNRTQVSDLSPLAGLINLELLEFWGTNVSSLLPLVRLINLEFLGFEGDNVSDLSQIAGLINLKTINAGWGSAISDLSPLAGLTKLEGIHINAGKVSDLTPLAGLTGLKGLGFQDNDISDISALAGLTELTSMNLGGNNISDISPLAGLINLKWLVIQGNQISDILALDGIRENITTFVWHDNPAFPETGPSIEGPWLWVVLQNRRLSGSMDLLSEASGGTVTETEIATHGATEGQPLADDVWTSRILPSAHNFNVSAMLGDRFGGSDVLYGTVSLYSPREQKTTIYVGSHNQFKVWLNGSLIYEALRYHASYGYTDFFPVTLRQGRNVLLVAVEPHYNAFFGFDPGTEYTVANPGVSYTFSKTPIHTGDTFTLDIGARDFFDLAGWQFDIDFDPVILEAINVTEGDFLKIGGGTTFFQTGTINNASGRITGFTAARTSTGGVSGTGTLLQVTFRAKARGETALTLQNVEFGDPTGTLISAGPHEIRITVGGQLATGDVNRDGAVTILDLILIARQLGQRVPANSQVDLNGDGAVSILDLILAARSLGSTTTPAAPLVGTESIDAATIAAWIAQARLKDNGSLAFKQGIEMLEKLLTSLIPQETVLLRNYPNPFNPETWIPYQLAQGTDVTLTIYDTRGVLVRQLDLGYQQAGYYADRTRAAYWNGHNNLGEAVGSGIYFYHLRAGDYSTTRKMLILK